jgi:hypothetical protein
MASAERTCSHPVARLACQIPREHGPAVLRLDRLAPGVASIPSDGNLASADHTPGFVTRKGPLYGPFEGAIMNPGHTSTGAITHFCATLLEVQP